MKASTAKKLANAIHAGGPKKWVVRFSYNSSPVLYESQPMSYRQATAEARAVREARGVASVERATTSQTPA